MERLAPKLFNWASILEDNTKEQAIRTSGMPFIFPHLALMPDAHLGKGSTVGSVIPTEGAVMPAAVGVDIGCGCDAVRTQLTSDDVDRLARLSTLRESIEEAIPLSAGNYNTEITETAQQRIAHLDAKRSEIVSDSNRTAIDRSPNWRLQLGSLGSGNHFIELCLDEQQRVWAFLHSGSRGVGNRIAQYHIKTAQELMKKWWITLPDPDLAYLVEGTDEFWAYIRDMMWAQEFARLNRKEMMDRVIACVARWADTDVERLEEINCHHNYTTRETHFKKQVWLSRKGAIFAGEGAPGLIPGSMGTASYVVSGKGNALSLNSSPHGAGRNFSRSAARKTFTHEQLVEAMKGIEWSGSTEFLDEIPGAYKDVDVVMADAADLVEVRHTLRQFLNVKGS
jgi:tRNA-splicing ligase RtcB